MDPIIEKYAANRTRQPTTLNAYRYRLNCWRRFNCSSADEFRKVASRHIAPSTIEDVVKGMITLGVISALGTPLECPEPQPCPPSMEDIGRAYAAAHVATWPVRLTPEERQNWWQAFIVVSLWTGARLSDIAALEWDAISSRGIRFQAKKTSKPHYLPLNKTLDRHLSKIHFSPTKVLWLTNSPKQLRDQWKAICVEAKIEPFTVNKSFRQASITMWSIANPKAGELIHGCGTLKGTSRILNHYLGQSLLEETAKKIVLPPEMLTADERQQLEDEEQELIRRYRTAPSQQRGFILQAARLTA